MMPLVRLLGRYSQNTAVYWLQAGKVPPVPGKESSSSPSNCTACPDLPGASLLPPKPSLKLEALTALAKTLLTVSSSNLNHACSPGMSAVRLVPDSHCRKDGSAPLAVRAKFDSFSFIS